MELRNLLDKNYKTILNIAVLLFVLIIANKIYKTQNQAVKLLRQAKDAELKKNSVLGEFSSLEEAFGRYKNLLQKKDAAAIINKISSIANSSEVKIISVKPENEARFRSYSSYPYTLSVIADNYHALGKFLSKLESYPEMYILIEGIAVRQEAQEIEGKSVSNLPAELKLSVISYQE